MKIFSRLVISLLFIAVFSPGKVRSQVSFESEEQLVAQANKLFVSADYVNAMPLFSQLLSLHPKEANYNYKFGVCLLHNDEDKTKSLQYFDFAVKETAVDKEAFFYAGKGYQLNTRFDEALGFYEKYKSKLGATADPLDAARYIQQCKNGKNLYDKNVTLQAIEKTETLEKEFYRNYDLKSMKGRIIPKPLNFKSKKDVKMEDNTLIFVGTENQSIVYSGYSDEGLNTSRELFRVNKLPNGEWAAPVNIGEPVNTIFDEEFAFLHPDGKTLYFSSKGHNTMGGYDIFRSVFDEQSGKWSAPVNLAHPINSPDDDIFYASDDAETFAYFASKNFTKPGKIKVYKIGTQGVAQSNLPLAIKGAFAINGERVYTKAEIKVTDKATNALIGTYNSNRLNGKYLLLLPPGKNYTVEVTPEDFVSHKFDLTVPAKASADFFEQKINLQKDATGETLTLTNWFDATGKTAGANLRSVYTNEQVAEKAKAENKKIISEAELASYKTQKAEEEKLHASAQNKAVAESESNKQEALLKAEKEKQEAAAAVAKAEEEKRKAEELAKAKAEEEKKTAEAAKLKAAEEEKKLAAARAEEEKRHLEETAKAKENEEQRLAAEKQKAEQEAAAKALAEKKVAEEAKLKAEHELAAIAEAEKKTAAEEKRKADELAAKAKEEEEKKLAAAKSEEDKKQAELKEAERERIENEQREAERVARINADLLEKERRLKELLAKAEQQNVKVESKHEFKLATDSLSPEQAAAYEKIQREKEEAKKAVEEQLKKDAELKAQQAKADALAQEKFIAEKAAIEKAQKEKEEQNRKMIEEQKLKEQQAAAEIERKNKAVMDSIAQAKNKSEKAVNTDSLAASNEAKRLQQLEEEAKLKAAAEKQEAEMAAKAKEAEEHRIAAEKLKAEMAAAEKAAIEKEKLEQALVQQEELKRQKEQLQSNLEEQKKLMEEAIRQQEKLKRIADSVAVVEKQKEQVVAVADETEKIKMEEAALKAEEQRKASELKAAEEKRKAEEVAKVKQAEEQRIAAEKEKAEKEALAKAETEKKAAEEKRKIEEVTKAKQEEEKRLALEQQKKQEEKTTTVTEPKSVNVENENETPEQRKLRQLLERMNAEQKGRQIVENNLKAQQQSGNDALANSQRYKEVVTNKEVVQVHIKEEKLRPPFDKTDLLSHQGVIYKLELKLPAVKLPDDIAVLLKPGTGTSEEPVYYSSGAYTTLAEATLDKNEFGYKGFSAAIIAYLNGQEINISEAKKQPLVE